MEVLGYSSGWSWTVLGGPCWFSVVRLILDGPGCSSMVQAGLGDLCWSSVVRLFVARPVPGGPGGPAAPVWDRVATYRG